MKKLSDAEIFDLTNTHQDWIFHGFILERKFKFVNFFEALSFVVKVGMLAEKIEHHPDICLFSYNQVSIKTFTHQVGGVTMKDIELIIQIDNI